MRVYICICASGVNERVQLLCTCNKDCMCGNEVLMLTLNPHISFKDFQDVLIKKPFQLAWTTPSICTMYIHVSISGAFGIHEKVHAHTYLSILKDQDNSLNYTLYMTPSAPRMSWWFYTMHLKLRFISRLKTKKSQTSKLQFDSLDYAYVHVYLPQLRVAGLLVDHHDGDYHLPVFLHSPPACLHLSPPHSPTHRHTQTHTSFLFYAS